MLRLRRFMLAMFVVVLGLIVPRTVEAQNTSQVFGRVTDTSGAVLPGVTRHPLESGAARTACRGDQ